MKIAKELFVLAVFLNFFVIVEPAPSDLLFLSSGIVLLFSLKWRFNKKTHEFYAAIAIFACANFVSALQIHAIGYGVFYLGVTLYLLLIPVIMASLCSSASFSYIQKCHRAFLVGCAISSVIGIAAFFNIMPGSPDLYFRNESGMRLSPFFKDPNVFGPFMVSGSLMALSYAISIKRTKSKIPYLFIGLTTFCASLLSFSRAAWLGGAVSALMFFLLTLVVERRRRALAREILFGGGLLVVASCSFLFLLNFFELIDFFEKRLAFQAYDANRFAAHSLAWEVVQKNPFGIGPGHFVGQRHFPNSDFPLATHNVYLKVWVENGLIGILSFLYLLFYLVKKITKSIILSDQKERRFIRIGLLSILIGHSVNSWFIDSLHWRHFFVIIAFSVAEIIVSKRKFMLSSTVNT